MKLVQLGTNRGNDHVLKFCKENNPEFILLVEPHPVHHEIIRENYKDILHAILEPVAITPDSKDEIELYYLKTDRCDNIQFGSYEIASIKKETLFDRQEEDILKITVKSMSINSLLEKYNLYDLDYLFMDIEGVDFDVVQQIDFSKYKIHNIQIEIIHLDKQKLDVFMESKGYYDTQRTLDFGRYDTIYTLRSP